MNIKSAILQTIAKDHPNFIQLTKLISQTLILLDINRINYPQLFKQVNCFILENSSDRIDSGKLFLFKRGLGIKIMPATIHKHAISI